MAGLSVADRETLEHLEASLWRAEKRFDRVFMDQVLADNFVEFGRSGRVHGRDDILAFVPTSIDARLRDFAAHLIAADVVLVTYISEVRDSELVVSNRSSLWTRKQGRWQLRFHQGTARLDD